MVLEATAAAAEVALADGSSTLSNEAAISVGAASSEVDSFGEARGDVAVFSPGLAVARLGFSTIPGVGSSAPL